MKNQIKKSIVMAVVMVAVLCTSCKKDKIKNYNLPAGVSSILSNEQLDKLVKMGVPINEGLTPPSIDSVYLYNNFYCTYDGSGDGRVGDFFADMKLRFTNQNPSDNTIKMSYKQAVEEATGLGSFIAGTGNSFTVFTKNSGTYNTIPFTSVTVFSGTKTATGISNMKSSLIITSKGSDPLNQVIEVNEGRAFKDNDGVSPFTTW